MRFNVKKAVKPAIAMAAILVVAGVAWQTIAPAWASKAISDALIDKDLESALKNHFQKRFFNLIDASDEQKKEISELISAQADDARPMRQEIKNEVMVVADLMADESTTDEQIKQHVEKIQALRDKLQDKRLDAVLKVRAKLTKEQKQIVSNRVKGILTGNPRLGLLGRFAN